MRIYLDTCVWCRPFDKLSSRVNEEREAFRGILMKVDRGDFYVVGSVILDIETDMMVEEEKRASVKKSIEVVISEKVERITKEMLKTKEEIVEKIALTDMDAYHIACAIHSGCEYFISTDDEIIKMDREIERNFGIRVCNPVKFTGE